MQFLNHLSPTFTQRSFLSLLTNFTLHLLNSSKPKVLQRSIHTNTLFKAQENSGFCLQDCVSLLHHLGDLKGVKCGNSLHSIFIKTGLVQYVFVQNNLIKFYGLCGDLVNARLMFDDMLEPNLVSWTSMVSCYVHDGQYEMGLQVYSAMCRSGLRPNEFGYSVALKACRIMGDFLMGVLIHAQIVKCGFELCSFCSSSILGMYVECGDIETARVFFEGISLWGRSEALWNTLLDGYVQISNDKEAFTLFRQMLVCSNTSPNCFTYAILIKLCANVVNSSLGRSFHGQIVKVGFENEVIVGGALVDTYAKLGFVDDACKVFHNLEEKNNVVWCALLAGFHQSGDAKQGLDFYLKFLLEGNKPDPFTYASLFSLCSDSEAEVVGSQLHCSFIKSGFMMDSFLGSALIDMYGGFGMISDAYKCFLEVWHKNDICFSAMINNLICYSYDEKALELFLEMRKLGLVPSQSTLSYAVRACANLHMLKEGRSLHSYIIKNLDDSDSNLCVENALIEMYTKRGGVDEAQVVFKYMKMSNEFSLTTMISCYNESGQFEEALKLFHDMLGPSVFAKPSQYTVVAVLQACAKLEAIDEGKQIHGYVIKAGFESHPFVGSGLINMYGTNASEIQNADLVFSAMSDKDPVSWSSMITAWAQNGNSRESLKLFTEFQEASIFLVDDAILSSCLSACAGLANLEMGKWFHACTIKTGFESHVHVASAIIDMYGKCGSIKDARKLFDGMRDPNLVSWTAMMSGYAHHGLGKEAVKLFNEMKESALEPDGVTFVGVLTACSHAGLVKEGWQYFESMKSDYGLEVTIYHYACMVDLLSRAGQLDEAETLINKAPFPSKTLLWKILLGACNKLGNVELGNRIAEMLVVLEPNEPSTYVLLSNIYASAAMWDNSMQLRNKMKEEHGYKQPGYSWIQLAS